MTLKVYNTMTRKKEVFEPLVPGKVTFYVCGPTVYNYIHIGNARSAVAFDVIRRYLEFRGYDVTYVSNFTDVDDKIIRAAQAEGMTPKELSDKYIQAFLEDTSAINIKPADVRPRVMDHIQEIIEFTKDLIDKGYAYVSQGDVYFSTDKFEKYGNLSDQSIADLRAGASERTNREEDERKENPLDFALWKSNKNDQEIAWDSPWGLGRPGWHIECSVMSTKYLGETIDIHGGGQDLQFPHHENEIAQSEAHSGHCFAKYWLHNGFVTMGKDDEKMSKSVGNVVFLRDMLKEEDPMVIRYLLSTTQYRRPLKYDLDNLQDARNNLARLKEVFGSIDFRRDHLQAEDANTVNPSALSTLKEVCETARQHFVEAMDDDFNVANAMSVIFDLVKTINRYLEGAVVEVAGLDLAESLLRDLLGVIGLDIAKQEVLDEEIEALIEERNAARKAKNFQRADEIRDYLKAQNILLDDTAQGTKWKRG